ncbi:MAG: type II toxin-antitoxin system RelE/ParE family toxin [Pseudomonadota bacterium]
MKLKLSARAESDFDAIETYTVETFGVRQWFHYEGQLRQGFVSLRRFPGIGMADRALPSGHQAFRVAQHWICYEVVGDVIEVTAIIRQLSDFSD